MWQIPVFERLENCALFGVLDGIWGNPPFNFEYSCFAHCCVLLLYYLLECVSGHGAFGHVVAEYVRQSIHSFISACQDQVRGPIAATASSPGVVLDTTSILLKKIYAHVTHCLERSTIDCSGRGWMSFSFTKVICHWLCPAVEYSISVVHAVFLISFLPQFRGAQQFSVCWWMVTLFGLQISGIRERFWPDVILVQIITCCPLPSLTITNRWG